jgi:hypothetical protein
VEVMRKELDRRHVDGHKLETEEKEPEPKG